MKVTGRSQRCWLGWQAVWPAACLWPITSALDFLSVSVGFSLRKLSTLLIGMAEAWVAFAKNTRIGTYDPTVPDPLQLLRAIAKQVAATLLASCKSGGGEVIGRERCSVLSRLTNYQHVVIIHYYYLHCLNLMLNTHSIEFFVKDIAS